MNNFRNFLTLKLCCPVVTGVSQSQGSKGGCLLGERAERRCLAKKRSSVRPVNEWAARLGFLGPLGPLTWSSRPRQCPTPRYWTYISRGGREEYVEARRRPSHDVRCSVMPFNSMKTRSIPQRSTSLCPVSCLGGIRDRPVPSYHTTGRGSRSDRVQPGEQSRVCLLIVQLLLQSPFLPPMRSDAELSMRGLLWPCFAGVSLTGKGRLNVSCRQETMPCMQGGHIQRHLPAVRGRALC